MTEDNKKRLDWYTYSEGETIEGQVVSFSAHPDDISKIKEALKNVRKIDLPVTGRVNVSHGGYGMYTRYDITQHEYAGGGPGYIEVLEIKNPPDNRCGIVVHYFNSAKEGSSFFEFNNLANAIEAWKSCWSSSDRRKEIKKQQGFLREVHCGGWTPWFYAVGNQMLEGDVVFMEINKEDFEFRFGQKYIVWDEEGFPTIKRCMGTFRHSSKENSKCAICNKIGDRLIVFWDDGTWWRSDGDVLEKPKLVKEDQLWIWEAVNNFREILSGDKQGFSINFMDGSKFTGKWLPKNRKSHHAEGNYYGEIFLKGGEIKKGHFDFKPTMEIPTVEALLDNWVNKNNAEVERSSFVKITKTSGGKKKWSGVYP